MDHPILILVFVAIIGLALALGIVSDFARAIRHLRGGVLDERRRDLTRLPAARGGYAALRPSPGHRNFGVPRKPDEASAHRRWPEHGPDDLPVLSGSHPGLVPNSGILWPNLDRLA